MISNYKARRLAGSLPEVEEKPHFALASFRIKNKIFATLWEKERKMMVKLSLAEQAVFCSIKSGIVYPVPGTWGKNGATFINLIQVGEQILKAALESAWKNTAPKKLKLAFFADHNEEDMY